MRRRHLRLVVPALLAMPPFLAFGLLRVVAANWHACTGSSVISSTYHQLAWAVMIVTPLACYGGAGLLRLVWRGDRVRVRAARLAIAYLVVSALVVFFTARYYSLTQHDCVDGIATWWPFPAW